MRCRACCVQLIQFELAVGATNCTHDNSSLVYHVTSHTDTPTNSSEEEPFEPPNYQQDPHDGLLCRKLAGVNYRDVQERCAQPQCLLHAMHQLGCSCSVVLPPHGMTGRAVGLSGFPVECYRVQNAAAL